MNPLWIPERRSDQTRGAFLKIIQMFGLQSPLRVAANVASMSGNASPAGSFRSSVPTLKRGGTAEGAVSGGCWKSLMATFPGCTSAERRCGSAATGRKRGFLLLYTSEAGTRCCFKVQENIQAVGGQIPGGRQIPASFITCKYRPLPEPGAEEKLHLLHVCCTSAAF